MDQIKFATQLRSAQIAYDNAYPYDDAQELADEMRESAVLADLEGRADSLLKGEDFGQFAVLEVTSAQQQWILKAAGACFDEVQAATDGDVNAYARAAVELFKYLKPYVETVAQEQARDELEKEYDERLAA